MQNYELEDLRSEIDELDEAILHLISERQKVVTRIARYKKEKALPRLDKVRWQSIQKARSVLATKLGLSTQKVQAIWDILHDLALQKEEEISKDGTQ
jgi:chorismate mutase